MFALGMFISLKLINIKGANVFIAITLNYFVAAVLTFVDLSINHAFWSYSSKIIFPSAIIAVLFAGSFILMLYSTKKVGIGLTTALNKMSILISVSVGVLYLGQTNALAMKLVGITVLLVSIFLILYKKSEKKNKGAFILPLMVFIVAGMIDSSMELANIYVISEPYEKQVFLFSVFAFAVLFSLIALCADYILLKNNKAIANSSELSEHGLEIDKLKRVNWKSTALNTLLYGSLLGLFNALTSKMILINVGNLGGSVVYPIHNASVVAFTTLIGVFFFRELFTKKQWIGVLLAVIGVSFIASTL